MKRRTRLILWIIASLIYVLIYFGVGGPSRLFSVYSFGFLEDPSRFLSSPNTSVSDYVSSMHELSPLWVTYIDILQTVTGEYDIWRYLIPTPLIITILSLAVLNNVRARYKWIISLAIVAGPLGIIGYSFVFARDAIDIILMITFLLILRTSLRRDRDYHFSIFTAFSFIFWLHHYTFWPMFAATVGVLTVLSHWHTGATIKYSSLVSIFTPFFIYDVVATIYFGSLSTLIALLREGTSDLITVITTFYYGQFISIPTGSVIVPGPEGPHPAWMPEMLYLAYIIPLTAILLVVLWEYKSKIRMLLSGQVAGGLSTPSLLFIAVVVGATATTGIYIIRGYLYRVFVFWPVVLPFILWIA